MFETALAQLRYATSVVFARPFHLPSLDSLVEGVLATQREFGALGPGSGELLVGPELDAAARRDFQLRRFRAQAGRAARETEYYRRQFDRLGIDPARLVYEDIARLPVTSKEALRDDPGAFVRTGSRPAS
jgi:hypothetical protein